MGKKAFSRRYFTLHGMTLSYYREIEAETPAGAVNLKVLAFLFFSLVYTRAISLTKLLLLMLGCFKC